MVSWLIHCFTVNLFRGGSRTAAISKIELFVIIVNGFQLLHNERN